MSDRREGAESAPIIRIAFTIIKRAIDDGASEILVEPAERVAHTWRTESVDELAVKLDRSDVDKLDRAIETGPGIKVSYKVSGEWREVMPLPDYVRGPLTDRFKLMADMDLSKSDAVQTGRIPICYQGKDYALLVETTPTPLGEKVLMRFE